MVTPSNYTIEVLDLYGRRVKLLAQEFLDPQTYYIDWNGESDGASRVSPGIYFIKISSEKEQRTIKVTYNKK